jgi:hypothetical protein
MLNTTYNLSSDFSTKLDRSAMLSWSVTAEQFEAIQECCYDCTTEDGRKNGSRMPSDWEGALDWASDRSVFLYSEAVEYCKRRFGANSNFMAQLDKERVCFVYADENHNYCDYQVTDREIAYETIKGTEFYICQEEDRVTFCVAIPLYRRHSSDHRSILLAIGGVTNATRNRWEQFWTEIKDTCDKILLPHEFPLMETWAELEGRGLKDLSWNDPEDYEDPEYEDE